MTRRDARTGPAACLTPGLDVPGPRAAFWLRQVALRLRREILWGWHQRGERCADDGVLPPPGDPVQESLDLTRYREEKERFFATDVTGRFLSERIEDPAPEERPATPEAWDLVRRELALDEASEFVLALGLAARLDAAVGPVLAACQNDPCRTYPTLALAQRLWNDPVAVTRCGDSGHALFQFGLLNAPAGREMIDWHQPIEMPPVIAWELHGASPRVLPPREPAGETPASYPIDAARYPAFSIAPKSMQIVPLAGAPGADFEGAARALAAARGRTIETVAAHTHPERCDLLTLAASCWLGGRDILLPEGWLHHEGAVQGPWHAAPAPVPVRWYLPIDGAAAATSIPPGLLSVRVPVPGLGYAGRVAFLESALGERDPRLSRAIRESARRYRLEVRTLDRVVAALKSMPRRPEPADLHAACRHELPAGLGHLAQAVTPRFRLPEVVLPREIKEQLREIARGMSSLSSVHHEWGTAKVWNEAGLAVLFCGPPGTGKTMSAEALANELEMPLYRIDLSQVVNKYIGETEKNLKRVFDAADATDCILLFDEADALFGKRTEVRDAHDRFANIEISYLLERMERFKGLAILATNRRKDLDEAFLRRLRYLVEFPVPAPAERAAIWREVFPEGVDLSDLDLRWLAERFEISGGHIRSAAFNACLQSAGGSNGGERGELRRVPMKIMVRALKRELEKMGRPASPEQFGRHARLLEDRP